MTVTEPKIAADGRDPRIEAWLDDHHVTWTFEPALPLASIDVAKSLANQARIDEPLIEDVVDQYTAAYRRGDRFPPLLARRSSKRATKVTLLGGNHRNAAASKAGRKKHPAYIVECEPETAIALTYEDNSRHGFPPSRTERLAQAVHLIDSGWTQEAAAAAVGVASSEVSNARSVITATRRARELKVADFPKLPSTTKTHLSRLQSDPVFAAASQLAVDGRLTAPETKELCDRVKRAGSDEKALAVIGLEIEARRDEIQATAGGRARKAAATGFGRLNNGLSAVLDAKPADVARSAPSPDAKKRIRERCKQAARHLMEIDKALGGR